MLIPLQGHFIQFTNYYISDMGVSVSISFLLHFELIFPVTVIHRNRFVLYQKELSYINRNITRMFTVQGMVPGLMGTSHGAIQFLVYERLKHWNRKRKNMQPSDKIVNTHPNFILIIKNLINLFGKLLYL